MRKAMWGLAVSACVVLGPARVTAAPPAPAKPAAAPRPKTLAQTLTGQALADYDAATLLITDGDYAGALIKFQAAYDASKDPRLLWNLAACEKSLRHYAKTIALLKRFNAEGGTLVTDKERQDASEFIKTLEPFTVALAIETEPDAEIEVDDAPVGRAPLASRVVVDIGQRRIRVHKEGYRDAVLTTSVGGSPEQSVTVKLEKELHEGKLTIQAPAGATILLDGKTLGVSKKGEALETVLASGGHTLRVTAPGMRVYEREVVVKDNETRAVEVQLERELEPERPKLRVAVGCLDAEPRGTDDGLAVYIDGSPAAATAAGGASHWDADLGRNVVEHVAYPVASGRHQVLVRIPGCEPAMHDVDVAPIEGATLKGALVSESPLLVRGPAGSPNWGRISLSIWMPSTIASDAVRTTTEGSRSLSGTTYAPSATGIMIQPGVVVRWWTAMLDFGYASGSAALDEPPANQSAAITDRLSIPPGVTWARAGIRTGARFPFHLAALMIGVGTGLDHIQVRDLAPALEWGSTYSPYGTAWAMVDAHVFCDWPMHFGFNADAHGGREDLITSGIQVGVAYQPNRKCTAERSTNYGLQGRR